MSRTASIAGLVPEFIKRLPFVRDWRRRIQLAHFVSPEGFSTSFGVFKTFAEARHSLPTSREFDVKALAAEYVDVRCKRLFCYDYPVMHWLGAAFRRGARDVLDIGGSVGVHFHAYRKFMEIPESTSWRVIEVPAIVQVGRELALRSGTSQLEFVDSLDPAGFNADIWLSAGAIHYIEDARPNVLLSASPRKPGHVILNKLPLYEGDDFVSAQNIGEGSFAPHHVYNRQRLVADIEVEGYRLVDSWDVPERGFYLPGHPEKSFEQYSGLYFARC